MFKFVNKMKNRKGFTLIELVVVIAILGILALIAIPRFAGVRDNAEASAATSYATTVINAAEIYYIETGEDIVTSGSAFDAMVTSLVAEDLLRDSDSSGIGDADFDLNYNSPGSWEIQITNVVGEPIIIGAD